MTAPVSQVLSEAADLLEKPGAWTQEVFARNAQGQDTGLSGFRGEPVCWCVLGATEFAAKDDAQLSYDADRMLSKVIPPFFDSISEWNDAPGRTQEEVVDALRRAAALAKEQGR